jgi:hypothetical protein
MTKRFNPVAASSAIESATGVALVSMGIACWPRTGGPSHAARIALLVYNALTTAYLGFMWIRGQADGVLLIPAIVAHAVFVFLLVRMRRT